MIGDTYNTDISFGNKLGIKTLLVYSGTTTKGEMNKHVENYKKNNSLIEELKINMTYDNIKNIFEQLIDPSYIPSYYADSLKDIIITGR